MRAALLLFLLSAAILKAGDEETRNLGFLPDADRNRVTAAYHQAIATHPDLKHDETNLRAEREKLSAAKSPAREQYIEKARIFQERLRAAMLRQDPGLAPTLTRIDRHRSQLRARGQEDLDDYP